MIYSIAHKEVQFIPPKEKGYMLLHVGTSDDEDRFEVRDSIGDNISEKNPSYCELTGMYWIWKNCNDEIKGIVHYRRYFVKHIWSKVDDKIPLKKKILSMDKAKKILNDYDIILGQMWQVEDDSIWEHYVRNHKIKDLQCAKEIIEAKYPEYMPAFDTFMNQNRMYTWNMFIAKKEVFDGLCEWLFDILFEVERKIDIQGYGKYQIRVFGFLAERLVNVYYLHNKLIKYESQVCFLENE